MKFTITTTVLQEMLTKAVKGASCDNQRPLTGWIAIQLKDNVLTMITSSETNYLYVQRDKITGDDFYVVVPVEILAKLVSKITAENTTLEIVDGNLVITGGGKYTLEVSLDADGEPVKYPDPYSSEQFKNAEFKKYPIKKSTLSLIMQVNSAAIANGEAAKSLPEVYRGYYISDSIMTTDTIKMCDIGIKICEDSPILVRPETMELTELFSDENLEIMLSGPTIVIHSLDSVDCIIMSKLYDNIEDFQIDALRGLLDTKIDSECSLNKTQTLQALDRLSLFVSKLDDYGVYLTFTQDGLKMSNDKSSGEEVIDYLASDNFKPFACKIDIRMLTEQVKAAPGDVINMQYGNDICVKFIDGNVTQLCALLERAE